MLEPELDLSNIEVPIMDVEMMERLAGLLYQTGETIPSVISCIILEPDVISFLDKNGRMAKGVPFSLRRLCRTLSVSNEVWLEETGIAWINNWISTQPA